MNKTDKFSAPVELAFGSCTFCAVETPYSLYLTCEVGLRSLFLLVTFFPTHSRETFLDALHQNGVHFQASGSG